MDSIGQLLFAECVDNWAKSLAEKASCTIDDLVPLLSYATEEVGNKLKPLGTMSSSEQLAILALTKFVSLSKGKFQDQIIPLATNYYQLSLEFAWLVSNSNSLTFFPVDNFLYSLTKRLLECADGKWGMQEKIISTIHKSIQRLLMLIQSFSDKDTGEARQAPYISVVVLPSLNGILRALIGIDIEISFDLAESLLSALVKYESEFDGSSLFTLMSKYAESTPDIWDLSFSSEIQPRLSVICQDLSSLAISCAKDLVLSAGKIDPNKFQTNWSHGKAQFSDNFFVIFEKSRKSHLTSLLEQIEDSSIKNLNKLATKNLSDSNKSKAFVVFLQSLITSCAALYGNQGMLSPDCKSYFQIQILMKYLENPSKSIVQNPVIYQSIIQTLGIFGQCFKEMGQVINQVFSSLIFGNGKFYEICRVQNAENRKLLKNSLGFHISKCLKASSNEELMEYLLHYVNALSSITKKNDIAVDVLVCIIGFLASEYPSELSSQTVTPMLANLLSEYSDSLEVVECILQFLPNLAVGRGFEAFVEVVDVLNHISLKSSSVNFMDVKINNAELLNKVQVLRHVTDNQMIIARSIKGFSSLNEAFLERLLLLFIEKGTQVIKREEKLYRSAFDIIDLNSDNKLSLLMNTHRELIWLLLIIRQCFINYSLDGVFTPRKEILLLIRSVWMLAMLIGTDEKGVWFPAWLESVTHTAKKTPLLVRLGSSKLIEPDLKTDPVVSSLMKQMSVQFSDKCDFLIKQFFDMTKTSQLEEKLLLFLLEIYMVESLMFDQPRLYRMYEYMQEMHNTNLYDQVKMIAEKMVKDFVVQYKYMCDKFSMTILNQVKNIILQYPCHFDQISNTILKHLTIILNHFPFVIRNNEIVLDTVFELLHVLFMSYNDEILGIANYSYVVQGQSVVKKIEIARGLTFRAELLNKYRDYWMSHLREVLLKSSDETVASLQTFLYKFINASTNYNNNIIHAGVALISELSVSKNACQDLYGISINPLSNKYVSNATRFIGLYGQQLFFRGTIEGELKGLEYVQLDGKMSSTEAVINSVKQELRYLVNSSNKKIPISDSKLYEVFYKTASFLITEKKLDNELFSLFCLVPVQIFTSSALRAAVDAWNWFIVSRPDLELRFLNETIDVWEWAIRRSRGIFSHKFNVVNTFSKKMNYGATHKGSKELETSIQYFLPHLIWIQFLNSHYEKYRGSSRDHTCAYLRFTLSTMYRRGQSSNHPIARLCFFKLWLLCWKVIKDRKIKDWHREYTLKTRLYELLLGVLGLPAANAYDSKFMANDIETLLEIFRTVKQEISNDLIYNDVTIQTVLQANDLGESDDECITGEDDASVISVDSFMLESEREIFFTKIDKIKNIQTISIEVLELELHKLLVWYNPIDKKERNEIFDDSKFRVRKRYEEGFCRPFINNVWNIYPRLAISLAAKGFLPGAAAELEKLVTRHSFFCTPYHEAIQFLLRENTIKKNITALKYLIYWAPVTPITAISFFIPTQYNSHRYIIQYGLRSLDCYPVELVFFYVPQIVQTLRHDVNGYAEQFIVNTAKINQLFAHQIIWNMNANKVEEVNEETGEIQKDDMTATYAKIIHRIIQSLSGADKDFYEREFSFFGKITGISGKLKPFIKRPKSEKKKKIDEELKLIQVDPGVYLPSNPESIVIDIDYKSGKPLQSHAKAPFMATFKIRKNSPSNAVVISTSDISETKRQTSYDTLNLQDDQNDDVSQNEEAEDDSTWQSAIFKVGDDCRQDLLALQLIAIFNNIFSGVGLDLFLFPYRVVATAPGCGIIEVVPKSVSRDQMGRSNINDLYQYFLMTYGDETSLPFQKARDNFIKSLAAYSVILYLLQIKDRHNGNVLVDEEGHFVHIDFGYIFDITPGGVKFELSPFKLTKEMIQIMGGSANSKYYKNFVEYCVKAFLACRPYADQICQMVFLMLESGLPCFKGELSIIRLRERFQLQKSEKLAAQYMIGLVQSSHRAWSTYIYDGYQKLTNGIPF